MSYPQRGSDPESLPPIHQTSHSSASWVVSSTATGGKLSTDRRELFELQEQVKAYKEDLRAKESLIAQLSSVDSKLLPVRNADDNRFEKALEEAAALQVKLTAAQSELTDVRRDKDTREAQLRDMRQELEAAREAAAQSEARADTLRSRLSQMEQARAGLEEAGERGSLAVSSLQSQNASLQKKVADVTAELRIMQEERDSLQIQFTRIETQHTETWTRLSTLLGSDKDLDAVALRIQELQREVTEYRSELGICNDKLRSRETEIAAQRQTNQQQHETIARLQKARDGDQKVIAEARADFDRVSEERTRLDVEAASLRDRIEASERAWEQTKSDIREKEQRIAAMGTEIQQSKFAVESVRGDVKSFMSELRSSLTQFLGGSNVTDTQVVAAVKDMCSKYTDLKLTLEQCESRLNVLASERDTRTSERDEASRTVSRLQAELADLEAIYKRLKDETAALDAVKEHLHKDKQRYMEFLEQLARAMKLDRIAHDVGFEMNAEALLTRAEQLVTKETEEANDRKTCIYNLQRKIKTLKEQLESKDLHLDLLRKKIAGMEEKLIGKGTVERERDNETLRVRKLTKTIDRYQKELAESRAEVRELKANLLDHTQYRLLGAQQSSKIGEMESYVTTLETKSEDQHREITELNEAIEFHKQSSAEQATLQQNAVKALSSELRTTKLSLEDAMKREKQLIDLREVVARLLGLDVAALAVPDYEIISRLEKLVQSHTAHVYSTAALDAALEDMEDGFRMGYDDPRRVRRCRGRDAHTVHFRKRPQSAETPAELRTK